MLIGQRRGGASAGHRQRILTQSHATMRWRHPFSILIGWKWQTVQTSRLWIQTAWMVSLPLSQTLHQESGRILQRSRGITENRVRDLFPFLGVYIPLGMLGRSPTAVRARRWLAGRSMRWLAGGVQTEDERRPEFGWNDVFCLVTCVCENLLFGKLFLL